MDIVKEQTIDLLDQQGSPALSSTGDMPVVETKPDATAAEPVKAPEPEQPSESATEATDEAPAEPAKKESRGVQKALDRLTAEREAEKRRADEQTEARIRLEERLKLLEEQKDAKPQDDAEPVRPSQADFPDPDSWADALIAYTDKRAAFEAGKEFKRLQAEEKSKADEVAATEKVSAVREAYNARIEKTKEKYADFNEVAERPDVQVPATVVHAILHDENGPDLQYHLGKHPEIAQKLMALEPASQLIEIGRILGQLAAPPAPKPPVSTAPRPIRPITSGETQVAKDPETMSMDEYAAYRKEQSKGRAVRH